MSRKRLTLVRPRVNRTPPLPPSQLGALPYGADLQLVAVLLQYRLVVVLPKGLGGVLAGEALENLLAARVLVLEGCSDLRTRLAQFSSAQSGPAACLLDSGPRQA